MAYRWNKITQFAVIGAAGSLAVWIGSTTAKEESSVLVNKPVAQVETGPVLPPPAKPSQPVVNSKAGTDPLAPTAKLATSPQPLPVPPQPPNSTVKRPFMRPAEPARGKLVGEEPMPGPANSAPGSQVPPPSVTDVVVKPAPPIEYDTDGDARDMYRTGQIELVMLTKDPADGCMYEIPMCIPACCVGEPRVSGGLGILGRGKVEYCWPCGFRAIVKFRHLLGDIEVEYEGD